MNGRRLTTDGTVSEKYTNIKLHDKLISEVFNYVDPNASITGDSIRMGTHHREFAVQKSSGTLNGKGFTLRIKKENEDGQPLSGAEFTIENTRTKDKKNVITDENGIAELKNVVREEYVIKEVKAPDGYVLDENEQYISKAELKTSISDSATVTKVFVNKKERILSCGKSAMSNKLCYKIDSIN